MRVTPVLKRSEGSPNAEDLIAAGRNVKAISRRLGHASISFTLDRYGHLLPDDDSEAAEAVAAMIDKAAGQS